MMTEEDSNIINVPTRGQVCTYNWYCLTMNVTLLQPLSMMAITKCRVSSSNACNKTLLRRSAQLSQLRKVISGGETSTQFQSELRCLTRAEREDVLKDAHLPVVIPAEHALALKANLALPWAKLRSISR